MITVVATVISPDLCRVSEPAENALKKVDIEGALGDRGVVEHLFGLYAGHEVKNVSWSWMESGYGTVEG